MVFYISRFDPVAPAFIRPRVGGVHCGRPGSNDTARAKVFTKNSIGASALSGCISSRLCTKTLLFELQKRAVLPLKHHFCVGQTAVYTERLTGRYVRSKREGVFGKDFCPCRGVPDCLKIVLRVGFGCCEWGGGVVDFC